LKQNPKAPQNYAFFVAL